MMPPEPTPEQRRRDGRLAWLIVWCSAGLTLVVVVVGLVALRSPLARWSTEMAANSRTRQVAYSDDTHDAGSGEASKGSRSRSDTDEVHRSSRRDGASLPTIGGEIRKQTAPPRVEPGAEASVRRGNGPREGLEPSPTTVRPPGRTGPTI